MKLGSKEKRFFRNIAMRARRSFELNGFLLANSYWGESRYYIVDLQHTAKSPEDRIVEVSASTVLLAITRIINNKFGEFAFFRELSLTEPVKKAYDALDDSLLTDEQTYDLLMWGVKSPMDTLD